MYSPVLSIPARRVSAWVAETDPKYARAWLGALPLANSAESAREIYQALYTLNRLELRVPPRLELMALYEQAVGRVCSGLLSHLAHAVPPLAPKKRQLAEFIRRLHVEMAYGYKCCLRDLSRARLSLRRKSRVALCIERALYHLSEVLLGSYRVYLPHPAGVWREMHELYRLAGQVGVVHAPQDTHEQGVPLAVSIGARYVRALLLGLLNPYQLPHNAVQQAHAFLAQWGRLARVLPHIAPAELKDANGLFFVQLTADAAPVPLARSSPDLGPDARVLDARALLQAVQDFITRLGRGEHIEKLGLGLDCLDSACADLLVRMKRAWGETARRRYASRQRSHHLFICVGLNALHYFLNGQRPFAVYCEACFEHARSRGAVDAPVAYVDLDQAAAQPAGQAVPPSEVRRVDRWRLRDSGPQGMSVACYGDAATPTRVGELIGVQQPSEPGRWRAAVIRWVKAPEANSIEAGIETLAATVAPAAVRLLDRPDGASNGFPALRLPPNEIARRPSTLLLPRGRFQAGDELELLEEEAEPRRVRLLRLIERTGSFEQMVYGDVAARVRRR